MYVIDVVRVLTIMIDGRQKSYVFDFLFDHGGQRRFAMQLLYNISGTRARCTRRVHADVSCRIRRRVFDVVTENVRRREVGKKPSKCTAADAVICDRILTFFTLLAHMRPATHRSLPFSPANLSTTLRRARVVDARETMTDGLAVSADSAANGLRFLDQP